MSGKNLWTRTKAAGLAIALGLSPLMAFAQNLFATVAEVDGQVITAFEVQQRVRFLQVLNSPDASRPLVIDALIEERLRAAEAGQFGFDVTDEDVEIGMGEFAGRANLTMEELLAGLASAGVAPETLRDFVGAQILWRDFIRARFGNRVQISEDEIDRAVASIGASANIEVLVSEIIIPAPPDRANQVLETANEIAQVRTEAEFSNFARRFSATASRESGGRLDWTPINELPPVLRPLLLALAPGEVTAPLQIPNAVALFQLRNIRETDTAPREFAAIEYAAYYLAGGRSPETLETARNIAARVDRCDDLYGVAQGQPESALDRGSLPPDEIPNDVAIELAKLDPGEVSTALTRANGETLVFLMLCGRTPALPEDQEVNRGAIADQLRQRRLTALSDNLTEELRAQANIRILE